MSFLTVPLENIHKKKEFDCGKSPLNQYLHIQAKQDVKRRLSACFVLADDQNRIEGYYTLSNASISREFVPEDILKKMPPTYQDLPATLLGRLAIDTSSKGKGLGRDLLIDALKRSFETSKTVGSMAVIVDPLDEDAENFYLKYGFIKLPDSGKMFLPMATIGTLFS